jgi:hypothetical protein
MSCFNITPWCDFCTACLNLHTKTGLPPTMDIDFPGRTSNEEAAVTTQIRDILAVTVDDGLVSIRVSSSLYVELILYISGNNRQGIVPREIADTGMRWRAMFQPYSRGFCLTEDIFSL